MAATFSPSDESLSDQTNNSTTSVDQQYKSWDIVKATQVGSYHIDSIVYHWNLDLIPWNLFFSTEYSIAVRN